jgi:antitoxin (DNA-binding transcriptional repressor) of toxin-antitoxin stability system
MAARGESITVTKHGVPVAMIVPVPGNRRMTKEQLVEAIMEHRKGRKLPPGMTIRQMIDEGRKY